jgi:hypothetical protein
LREFTAINDNILRPYKARMFKCVSHGLTEAEVDAMQSGRVGPTSDRWSMLMVVWGMRWKEVAIPTQTL